MTVIPADDRKDALAERFRKHPFHVVVGTTRCRQDCSLTFASRPGDASIPHFDGPRRLTLHPYSDTLRRGETCSLAVQLLTPGLSASMRMEAVEGMENIHPVVEIECPPRWPGAEPLRFRIELPGRG